MPPSAPGEDNGEEKSFPCVELWLEDMDIFLWKVAQGLLGSSWSFGWLAKGLERERLEDEGWEDLGKRRVDRSIGMSMKTRRLLNCVLALRDIICHRRDTILPSRMTQLCSWPPQCLYNGSLNRVTERWRLHMGPTAWAPSHQGWFSYGLCQMCQTNTEPLITAPSFVEIRQPLGGKYLWPPSIFEKGMN